MLLHQNSYKYLYIKIPDTSKVRFRDACVCLDNGYFYFEPYVCEFMN